MVKTTTLKIIRFFVDKLGKHRLEKALVFVARVAGIDLLLTAYQHLGILKYWDNDVSGENFVIDSVLKKYFRNTNKVIFFDIGANIGDYSKKLRQEFSDAKIYAFEPNFHTFEELSTNLHSLDIMSYSLGLSSKEIKQKIYTYSNDIKSQHASIYSSVISELHKASQVLEIEFSSTTIDNFCEENHIQKVDFMKIDTEGHELEILHGGQRMISEKRIKIIQFEFNEMNIISRVFLKDFYELLKSYNIYRLNSNNLLPLFEYNSNNEIFKFQNFLAVHKELEEIVESL